MLLPAGSVEIVGFGAGAVDYFLPPGVVGPGHIPGAKGGWSEVEEARIAEFLDTPDLAEVHLGGNAVNALAYLACHNSIGANVRFISALGTDTTSDAIRSGLRRIRLAHDTVQDPDYHPSVSIIERLSAGSDRMVRGRPRTPLDGFITNQQIHDATKHADAVVAASLKSADLATRIFALTPEDAFVSYNPGSSEFNKPDALHSVMCERKPNLLALNDEEIALLFGADPKTVTPDTAKMMAEEASVRYAHNVLCTLGKDGLALANRGRITYRPANTVPSDQVVDTLGAGDRAHAVTLDGLLARKPHDVILREAAASTANLVQHVGAHGDLYEHIAA